MSIIKCPECDREISDKAISCPGCGCPITTEKSSLQEDSQIRQLINYCEDVLSFDMSSIDAYFYASLPLCVIDTIFSIGAKYKSTENTVKRYCEYYSLPRCREKLSGYPIIESQHTISQLINNIERIGIDGFTNRVLCNRQRTSAKSGILKSEAVYRWAKVLSDNGIEVMQDVVRMNRETENAIRRIPGQKSGISLSYFYMLNGNDDLCKPDRHILRFLSEALNREVFDTSEAQHLLTKGAMFLKNSHPNITVRLLDNAIWNYMSARK